MKSQERIISVSYKDCSYRYHRWKAGHKQIQTRRLSPGVIAMRVTIYNFEAGDTVPTLVISL